MRRIAALLTAIVLLMTMLAACSKPLSAVSAAEFLDLGEKYLLEMDYEQALVQFLKVIEIEPMNPRGYTGAAEIYSALGHTDKTMDVLRRGYDATGDASLLAALETLEAQVVSATATSTPHPTPNPTPTPEPAETSLFDVPDDIRQIFKDMEETFKRDDRQTVESLMEHEKLYAFMREIHWNNVLSSLYDHHSQVIKIANIVYTYFPVNELNDAESCHAVYVGFCSDGTGKYIEVFPSKHRYGMYGHWYGAQWTVFDLVEYNATGEYRCTSYAEDGSISFEEYGSIVNWKYEGTVTQNNYHGGTTRVESYTNGYMDGGARNGSPCPFSSWDEIYDGCMQDIGWPNL